MLRRRVPWFASLLKRQSGAESRFAVLDPKIVRGVFFPNGGFQRKRGYRGLQRATFDGPLTSEARSPVTLAGSRVTFARYRATSAGSRLTFARYTATSAGWRLTFARYRATSVGSRSTSGWSGVTRPRSRATRAR